METPEYTKAVTHPSLIEALICLQRIYTLIDADIDYLNQTETGTTHDDRFITAYNQITEEIIAISTERLRAELQQTQM